MEANKMINLNKALIFEKIYAGELSFCTELMREEFKLMRNENNIPTLKRPTEETIEILGDILETLIPSIKKSEINEPEVLLMKQVFQSLRNSSVLGQEIQNEIAYNSKIMDASQTILKMLLEVNNSLSSDCIKMELQFLCNLIVSNEKVQLLVWNKFSDLVKNSLLRTEVAHIAILLIYNILKEHEIFLSSGTEFICNILKLYLENIENVPLLLELLASKNLITQVYGDLDPESKITLLEIIYSMLINDSELPYELITELSENFKRKSDCVLKTVIDYIPNIEPLEVAKLLDCVSSASSKEKYLPKMQKDQSLLINCAFLLKSIHQLGKEGNNNFSSIQKLSELRLSDSVIQEHPVFGFKAALIRLLGNICWKHKVNQTLIRELDCIPLLMDCCNIDARNPLIIQWVILAIRNLSEGNEENQRMIAQMTKVGTVDSATLHEMGLTLHDDGLKKISIAPLNLNK